MYLDFQNIFLHFTKEYESILKLNEDFYFYPSKESTGFTERNLTVNFSKAYEKVHTEDKVVSWFEFPFKVDEKGRSSSHVDCVIVNYTTHEILVIESKRLNDADSFKSLKADFDRVNKYFKEFTEFKDRVEDKKNKDTSFNIYAVLLADWWPSEHKDIRQDDSKIKEHLYTNLHDEKFKEIALCEYKTVAKWDDGASYGLFSQMTKI